MNESLQCDGSSFSNSGSSFTDGGLEDSYFHEPFSSTDPYSQLFTMLQSQQSLLTDILQRQANLEKWQEEMTSKATFLEKEIYKME